MIGEKRIERPRVVRLPSRLPDEDPRHRTDEPDQLPLRGGEERVVPLTSARGLQRHFGEVHHGRLATGARGRGIAHGEAVAVSDDALMTACSEMARHEGIFAAPEGGAGLAAIQRLVEQGRIGASESVVLFNTGSGHKYGEAWNRALAT